MQYNLFAFCFNSPISLNPEFHINSQGAVNYSQYGAASPYESSKSREYNCYAYVLGLTEWVLVGGTREAVEKVGYDVYEVAKLVIKDLEAMGRTARIIDSYDSPISFSEYRIALRTGSFDYHFMVQHSDGSWSHKPSNLPTILVEWNQHPSEIIWWLYGEMTVNGESYAIPKDPNFYTSDIVYMAISK